MDKKIKVLIIDDSALARQVLTKFLSSDPDIEVVGAAADAHIGWEKIRKRAPDVVTLDVEMPRMDGITFLEKIMAENPLPVLMVSSLTEKGCETTLRALDLGAVDFVTKPKVDIVERLPEVMDEVIQKVKVVAKLGVRPRAVRNVPAKLTADAVIKKWAFHAMAETTDKVIAIGASTGGTEALAEILSALPADVPGICVVQHMPEKFTRIFSERLNSICKIAVQEAKDGDSVLRGHVLVAPGNFHMMLKRSGARYYVEVKDGPFVNRHRPSVDVLFRSVAQYAGKNAAGIILTGMGGDGARGLKEMREAGAYTIAQDEGSCVVFGMPKEAIEMGAADRVLSLCDIPASITGIAKNLHQNVRREAQAC